MNYTRALDSVAIGGILIASFLFGDVLFDRVMALPSVVHAAFVIGLVGWTAGGIATERTDKVPATVLYGGLVGMIGGAYAHLGHTLGHIGHWGTAAAAIPVGIVAWFFAMVTIACIIGSIIGIDVNKRRYERVDDPYGDPHAAEILENVE